MLNSVKVFLLKKINKNHVFLDGEVKILGQLPHFKVPKNGIFFWGITLSLIQILKIPIRL